MPTSDIKKGPLYVDSTNNRVGIGTSSPSGALHLSANTNDTTLPSIVLQDTGTTSTRLGVLTNTSGDINLSATSSLTDIRATVSVRDDRNILFNTAGTEAMRIDSSGNVGIGTASPSATLQVEGTTNGLQSVFGLDSSGLKISTFQKTGNDAGVILDAQESSNGTLTFATTGSERLRIDSSGNVGIGNDNPQHKFHITHSGTGAIPTDYQMGATSPNDNYQGIHNNNNSATFSGLALETRTSGASRWLIANEWKGTYLGDLVFRNRNGGTTSQESMRIDSSGRVTMPYQPAFSARKSAGQSSSSSPIDPITFGATTVNVGNHFDTSTSQFTAPVAGTYWFAFGLNVYRPSSSYISIQCRVNGSTPSGLSFLEYSSTSWTCISAGFALSLSANDIIKLVATFDATSSLDNSGYFSGYLIG